MAASRRAANLHRQPLSVSSFLSALMLLLLLFLVVIGYGGEGLIVGTLLLLTGLSYLV